MLNDWILIDTSVWIENSRKPKSELSARLERLLKRQAVAICGVVIAELLQGLSEKDKPMLSLFKQLPRLPMEWEVYERAGNLGRALHKKGLALSLSDALIAGTALEARVPLFTLDGNFKNIPELDLWKG